LNLQGGGCDHWFKTHWVCHCASVHVFTNKKGDELFGLSFHVVLV